ncbi:MAG TPA: DinB family protein [Humisphaera sp.]
MPESDPLRILLAHDRWATGQILDACDRLAPDALHRRFDLGPGSLHDALAHVAGAAMTWTDTLAGREPRPRPDDGVRRFSASELRTLLDDAYAGLAAEADRRPLGEVVTRRLRTGQTIDMTRGAVLTHVATHGMHHRAQCLNMLRQLGVSPLPPSSVTEWTWLGEKKD